MERIPGAPLDTVWCSLSPSDRVRIAADVGRWLGALHALDVRAFDAASPIAPWRQFISEQAAHCTDRHQSRGLAAPWAEQIAAFLDRARLAPLNRIALLHTEIMRTHVFVRQDASGWSPSGIIDFEPRHRRHAAGARQRFGRDIDVLRTSPEVPHEDGGHVRDEQASALRHGFAREGSEAFIGIDETVPVQLV